MYKLAIALFAGMFGLQDPALASGFEPEDAEGQSSYHFDTDAPFKPSADAMTDVDAALMRARASGKLAMIVMGANWCHDSMGLIEHLSKPEVAAVVKAGYEVQIVDVGYLDHGLHVATRFGLPVIYGTPTVLVIEPESETLLNADTVNIWRDAAAMPTDKVISLFAGQNRTPNAAPAPTGELARLMAEIKEFESKHAARIYGGFAIVGPMLAADERPEHFGAYWTQLRDLRYSITEDLARLRQEARTRTAAGETGITLDYPDYPPFDWEKESR
ncbi:MULTISPECIES: hypothetical protein [Kordiimonas]|jgi:hypothetical protein|uniref:hypothetical protein n=1 Tax=Kordiimonas TaxID=288021 RepID=UPI00257E2737|nr:hypothetical protein [Kordiimonas sp. UBA4487]